jgi:hypothetical protein
MGQFILLGLLLVFFFVVIREDVKNWYNTNDFDSEDLDEPGYDQKYNSKHKAKRDAIVDMSEEGIPTMLLRYDNFFKETYW